MQFWHMLKIMVYKVQETSHWTIFHGTVGHFRLIANKDITWECGFYFGYNNVHVKYGNLAFPKCQEYFFNKSLHMIYTLPMFPRTMPILINIAVEGSLYASLNVGIVCFFGYLQNRL